jgi:hypothetical protein
MCGFGIGTIFQVAIFVIVVLVVLALLRILLGDFFASLTSATYWNVIQIVIGGVVAILILLFLWRLAGARDCSGRSACWSFCMSDYTTFVAALKDHANRGIERRSRCVFHSRGKPEPQRRAPRPRMIQNVDGLIAARAPIPR